MAEINDLVCKGDALIQGEINLNTEVIGNGNATAKVKQFAIKLNSTTTSYTLTIPSGKYWVGKQYNNYLNANFGVVNSSTTDASITASYHFVNSGGTTDYSVTATCSAKSQTSATMGFTGVGLTSSVTFTLTTTSAEVIILFEVIEY